MGLTRIRAEQISDIDYKQAVRVITLTDISLSGGAPNQVDGVNLIANDRVLVAGNDPASENGLYIVQTVGAGSNGTWVRSTDGNSSGEIEAGMIVMVTEGVAYKDTQWKLTTNNPIVIGSTSLVFELNNSTASGNSISNGTSNVSVSTSNGNVTVGVAGTANVLTISSTSANITGSLNATGNITGNYIIGDGSQLTGLPASYGNANVAANLAAFANNPITTTGNITAGYFIGNGSQLTGLPASYSDANVATFMAAFGSNTIVTTGNITGGNVISNGVRAYKWTTVANTAPSNAVAGDNWYDSYSDKKYQYTYDGTSSYWVDQSFPSTYASLTITGNTTTGNLSTGGVVTATGNITGGNVVTTGNVLVGNVIVANNGANGITLYQSNGTTKATNTTGVILALGDSWIGGGYMANSTTVWANVASRAFQATVVNRAVGGRLSADVLANLTTDVAAAGGYNNINCAVINVGGNDKLQDPAANIAQYNTVLYNNLTSILNVLTGNGVPVILSPAPDFDRDDFYITGIAPDYAAPINTGQYVDDPQYAVIANNYQGVTVSTNSMSYLFNHPAEFLIPGGFHPTLTQGQQCFVDIIASAGQGLNQNSLNAAMTMDFDLIGFNQGIEIGTTTLASTPFIDFHSSGNSTVDYDSRIIGSGGNGAAGTGNINFFTNNANVSGNILSSGLITATGNITGGNLSAGTGTVRVGSIVNANANGVGNIGSATGYFNTVFAKATSAQYADLAELYVADAEYAPGTVVEFGGVHEITASKQTHSSAVAGIISTQPSYLMNSAQTGEHVLPVALTGRVPCQVVGKIRKGDRLVASAIPGVAIALDHSSWTPGCIIGKSLEVYDSDDVGVIEVAVGRT